MIERMEDALHLLMCENIRSMLVIAFELERLHIGTIPVCRQILREMPHNKNSCGTMRFAFAVPTPAPRLGEFHGNLIIVHCKILAEVVKRMEQLNLTVVLNAQTGAVSK